MEFSPNVTSLLASLEVTPSKRQEAGQCLSYFNQLSAEQKKPALPSTIKKIFPQIFADEVAIQNFAGYQDLLQKPWSTNCYLSPSVIVSPSSAQQVCKVLALCRFLGAIFSIRGGGHLQNPGFCSNDGGVVICLSKFRDVTISKDRRTANIGVGLTWLEVYNELDQYDVAVTGGRMPTVGVSGLLLGGGLSFHNSEHGFSCSSVVNYEVVLADSRIINANASENSDLFWALKGGCCNFGIITGIEMTTLPNKVWGETRLYSTSENDQLIKALMSYHEAIENNNKAVLYFHVVKEATLLTLFYADPVESRPAAFDCFNEVAYMKQGMKPGKKRLLEIIAGIADVVDTEKKLQVILLRIMWDDGRLTLNSHEMRTMSSLPDLKVYQVAEEMRKLKEEELTDVEGLVLCMSIQPIGPSAMTATISKGGSPMSIPAQNHQWFLVMADWKHAKDEVRVRAACRDICDAAESTAKENGTYLPFVYANYASRDQNPLLSYGTENLAGLKKIAGRYDPDGIFQTLQNGGWLLSRA